MKIYRLTYRVKTGRHWKDREDYFTSQLRCATLFADMLKLMDDGHQHLKHVKMDEITVDTNEFCNNHSGE
jgi:hypothetical protein